MNKLWKLKMSSLKTPLLNFGIRLFSEKFQQFSPKDFSFYIETYGCVMNEADSQTVISILEEKGFNQTNSFLHVN
jgi:hypothetical protein